MTARAFGTSLICVILLGMPCEATGQVAGSDRIHGRVVTATGEAWEGFIRWDLNEASWTDLLDGSRSFPPENVRLAEEVGLRTPEDRERTVELFGVRVTWEEDDAPDRVESGVRFGHLRSLQVLDNASVRITLKGGHEVELREGSTDIGSNLRGIVVADPERGRVELEWEDLARVEFSAASGPLSEDAPVRLHGTLTDRWGRDYTGNVAWDLDEVFELDVLDGREDGQDRKIPFRDIAAIERRGSGAARILLVDGQEVLLEGSDDVSQANRGIQVADPRLGQVQVGWSEFESLRLHPPATPVEYGAFDGGHRLEGVVVTGDGQELRGFVRWDNDEAWSWEMLDGEDRGVVYDVELGLVERIEKRPGAQGVGITLRDGRRLELSGSNDVDDGNKGILVELEDGRVEGVPWGDFRSVIFSPTR